MTRQLQVKSCKLKVASIRKLVLSLLLLVTCYLLLVTGVHAETYTVKKGDSLYKISKKFNIPVSAIKEVNNLKSVRLKTGMKLVIPDSNKKQKKNKTANQTVVSKNNAKVSNKNFVKESLYADGAKTYAVKKGDTIWRISKRFDLSVDELKELNGLTSTSLKIGQKLVTSRTANEPKEPEDINSIKANYDRKATPIITSARLEEIKDLSNSKDISEMGIRERLILFAKKMLHLPYKFGGTASSGLDCSAYVQKVYSVAGIELPRSAREQFKIGEAIDKEELVTGDLVFFRTYASFPSHVGIYLGNNLFIHASTRSKKITIDSLDTPYFLRRFIGAKRLIDEDEVKIAETPAKEN
jgi:cell wall-associated NlpC family hydrolase